jgi:hypothetical protein
VPARDRADYRSLLAVRHLTESGVHDVPFGVPRESAVRLRAFPEGAWVLFALPRLGDLLEFASTDLLGRVRVLASIRCGSSLQLSMQ